MTVTSADARRARPKIAAAPSRGFSWLLVPVVMALGGAWMVSSSLPRPGETVATLLATPDLLAIRASDAAAALLPTWVGLTIAGLATGMIIFLMASGLTLVFGVMRVANFGHGAFAALGAAVGSTVLLALSGWAAAQSPWLNLAALGVAALAAAVASGALGAVFERGLLRPVEGAQVRQILVTIGALVVVYQVIAAVWGQAELPISPPEILLATVPVLGLPLSIGHVVAIAVGLVVAVTMRIVLLHSRTGLVIRAATENGEMVEALGYSLRSTTLKVFVAGSALAGIGGILWALDHGPVAITTGAEGMVLAFAAVLVGGLGSVAGCLIAALSIGLVHLYAGTAIGPDLTLAPVAGLMALVLLWRPAGLMGKPGGGAE